MKQTADARVRDAFDRVLPRIYAYGLALGGDAGAAQDLAQGTCLRALEKAAELRAGADVDVWLFEQAYRIWSGEMQALGLSLGADDADGLGWLRALDDPQDTAVYLMRGDGMDARQAGRIVLRGPAKVEAMVPVMAPTHIDALTAVRSHAIATMPELVIPPESFADLKGRHKRLMARLAAGIAVTVVAVLWLSGVVG